MNYVFGTADELRRLADLQDSGQPDEQAYARTVQDQRIAAVQARHPGIPIAELAGRILCDAALSSARARHWFRNQDGGISADMYLYGEVGEWGISAAGFVQDLHSITATDIALHLNSPGGEVFDGFAIRNALRDHPAAIEVRIDGLAASIASVIAMAGNKIIVNRQGIIMIHDASGVVIGNALDMRQMADVLDKISDEIARVYAGRAGGTPASWRKAMKDETWYSAEQAVTAGLADELVTDDATADPIAARASAGPTRVPVPAGKPTTVPAPAPDPYALLASAFSAFPTTKEAVS
jgi:ATP-dependent protease ClpP protease subunit